MMLLLPLCVAQEVRPDEHVRVYQENGKWSRQITGSLASRSWARAPSSSLKSIITCSFVSR